ncbi:hypothetical protein, conserved [Entamoeba dispar SAW760]|uniref:PPPDE domain-containing protein n=1 Tax=Entamoeba dispar (strain ATCC PRA-260 / SAW760) TaxID=370354 RepID=B0E6Z7_ENTDS|nr:uncharacterized protein EDI_251750 [Entamoeba dispar SAW760]EDR29738.1 hypothetical protein, conserved [Entamoeba dispar SAW760]|eukprot:EDR29738.1 hypothetical protein, conserved [Entamoeba dispar SAW760]
MDNTYLYPIGMGAYHTGVCIFGREYSFCDGGIFDTRPKDVEAPFRTSINMGIFRGNYKDLQYIVDSLRSEFAPGTYNLYNKNCNCFSNTLCLKLVQHPIPTWINRMAWYGNQFEKFFGIGPQTQQSTQITHSTSQIPSFGHKLSETPSSLPNNPEERRQMIIEQYKKTGIK